MVLQGVSKQKACAPSPKQQIAQLSTATRQASSESAKERQIAESSTGARQGATESVKETAKPNGASHDGSGYVFVCNNKTQKEVESLRLFGSPISELKQMTRCIKEDTKLFLFNFQTWNIA